MSAERVQRRLVAIVAADVAGYSRLMEQDERGTLALLKECREKLDHAIAANEGRVVKEMGDGVLIEFASAVNAVSCAIAMQEKMARANDDIPEERQMVLRIGINLGDVMIEGGDLYGDGVNIAARLQSQAEPGEMWLSEQCACPGREKLPIDFDDLGPREMKNLARPVHAYRIGAAASPPPGREAPPPRQLRIAVLPFANMSGDPDQQYFTDGITEDIITELSRFRQLHVLARNSSFRYRDTDVDMVRIGRELNVDYLVEGSVRRLGQRIRITAQLIDARSGNHLWAERFDRDEKDIFEVQDQVVRTIVGTLVGRVNAAGAEGAKRKPPASLAAYEYVLRADALPFSDPAMEAEAEALYRKAIELDPTYARAYALLANILRVRWDFGMVDDASLVEQALDLAKTAVALDQNDGACQGILGLVHLSRKDFDLAEHHYQKALTLNRNSATLHASMGSMLSYIGKTSEAIEAFKEAKELDPYLNPSWYWAALGVAHFITRDYDAAIASFNLSSIMPYWVHAYMAASYAFAGRQEKAKEHAAAVLRLFPGFRILNFSNREPFKRQTDRQHLIDGLRGAGLPD